MNGIDTAVAVIGISFELPRCSGWESLVRILRDGTECVGRYPQSRVAAMGLLRSDDDGDGCWQEDIGSFDHGYFGLSLAEAELIDPRQRRMLRLAVDAIGNGGYSPAELRGRNVTVLTAGYSGIFPSLFHLLTEDERDTGRALVGSLPANAAGRIAYQLDLRGAALVIDTACSSFLVALHQARWMLARGESEMALVGGYAALLGGIPRRPAANEGMGVGSSTGHCRPFDAAADGTVIGEGGGFLVLRRLADALHDGDVVHAVIRGSALNQDAGRSAGLTSPSPVAQAEVITAALRDADIDPAAIGYVEAHGTGTRIGDPIEMQGLAAAYGTCPAGGASRPVSSVKANFGHLDAMAGFAGLVRVIAQFRTDLVFPAANFAALNPMIDLADVPLHVPVACEPWPRVAGPHRAGISGFGLSGTNAHVIVEEGARRACPPDHAVQERVVVLSARSHPALRHLAEQLREAVTADGAELGTVADVLAVGREHFDHRYAWVTRDLRELGEQVNAALATDADHTLPPTPVLLGLGDSPVAADELIGLAGSHPAGAELVARAENVAPVDEWSAAQRSLVWLVAQHAILAAFGARFDLMLTHGAGVVAGRVISGELEMSAGIGEVRCADTQPDRQRLKSALAGLGPAVTLIDLAPGGALSAALASGLAPALRVASVSSVIEALCLLYRQGRPVDWPAGLARPLRRLELPLAPMAEEPCWPRIATRIAQAAGPAGLPEPADDGLSIADTVLRITREVLKTPVTLADDFFNLGGDSLSGAVLVSRLNELHGTDLDVLQLYDFPDLAALADEVGRAVTARPTQDAEAGTDPHGPQEGETLSGQQAAIWAAVSLNQESDAYNVPAAFLIHGYLDADRLAASLDSLVARHGMLRCTLQDDDADTRQCVARTAGPAQKLQHLEIDLRHSTAGPGREALLARLRELVSEPFRPYDVPSTRFHLVRVRFRDREEQVLLLTFHHLFFDGWSWGLVMEDLAATPPPAPCRSYLDYVRDQREMLRGERGERLRRFWAGYLEGAIPGSLPADRNAQALTMAGADVMAEVGGDCAHFMRELASAERASLNMVFAAAWAVLLWQISGERDVCIAMPVANRPPGDEAIIGCYVNTILVRIRLTPEQTFGELLGTVRESSLRALSHSDFPTDHILRAGRHPSGQPLAATMLGFGIGNSPRRLGPDGPLLEPLDMQQADAQFPLELTVGSGAQGFSLAMKFATERFSPHTARAWLERYQALIAGIAEQGETVALSSLAGPDRRPTSVPELPDFNF